MTAGKPEIVMDTNVAVVANGKHEKASSSCELECVSHLRCIQDQAILLLDDKNLILTEYRNNLHPSGQPGAGDAFFRWLHDNQANPAHCRRVDVQPQNDREFEEFPEDLDLATFDRDDRKFVAVALASGTGPQIFNASDTDWWVHRHGLRRHGVRIAFLCPELMTD